MTADEWIFGGVLLWAFFRIIDSFFTLDLYITFSEFFIVNKHEFDLSFRRGGITDRGTAFTLCGSFSHSYSLRFQYKLVTGDDRFSELYVIHAEQNGKFSGVFEFLSEEQSGDLC